MGGGINCSLSHQISETKITAIFGFSLYVSFAKSPNQKKSWLIKEYNAQIFLY